MSIPIPGNNQFVVFVLEAEVVIMSRSRVIPQAQEMVRRLFVPKGKRVVFNASGQFVLFGHRNIGNVLVWLEGRGKVPDWVYPCKTEQELGILVSYLAA